MNLPRLIRYFQGERRGMGSELTEPSGVELTLLQTLRPRPSIAIQTSIHLADVSFWQETINFETMRAAGLAGVIIRAGQRNWIDARFRENWVSARVAGIPRGSYWFYDSRETPRKQAEIWSSLLAGDAGELVHACDFEESYGGQYGGKGHFKEFVNWFQDFSKLPDERIANYTGFFWWLERVGNDVFFRRFPLWLAWYSRMEDVKVPAPWHESELLFWQYTSSGDGALYGVSSREIDLNWYCCGPAHYKQRFHLGDVPQGEGETMPKNKVTITWNDGARERQDAHAAGLYRDILPKGSVHYSDLDPVPDVDDPANPNKRWIKLQSGWYIATRYPSTIGIVERAKVEPVSAPPAGDVVTANIDLDLTVDINGRDYHAAVVLNGVQLKPVE